MKCRVPLRGSKIQNLQPRERGHPFTTPIPWSLGPLYMPSVLLMFLILTFFTDLCLVSITTKVLKSGLKMRLARFINKKISYPGKGDIPSLWTPSHTALALYLAFYKDLCMVLITTKAYSNFLLRALFGFNYYEKSWKLVWNAAREV